MPKIVPGARTPFFRRMARESRDVWAKRVERWRASGLTAREFAAEIGVNAHTLNHWRWRLGQDQRAPTARARIPRSREAAFVEVIAGGEAAAADELIEIIVRDGMRIRVPVRFDADVLRRVVAVVEAR
jgi:transposase-like protein